MSSITITSSVKADDSLAPEFLLCCGLTPHKYTWAKGMGKDATSVLCSNPQCSNSSGVFACNTDIEKKWNSYRKEVVE